MFAICMFNLIIFYPERLGRVFFCCQKSHKRLEMWHMQRVTKKCYAILPLNLILAQDHQIKIVQGHQNMLYLHFLFYATGKGSPNLCYAMLFNLILERIIELILCNGGSICKGS